MAYAAGDTILDDEYNGFANSSSNNINAIWGNGNGNSSISVFLQTRLADNKISFTNLSGPSHIQNALFLSGDQSASRERAINSF